MVIAKAPSTHCGNRPFAVWRHGRVHTAVDPSNVVRQQVKGWEAVSPKELLCRSEGFNCRLAIPTTPQVSAVRRAIVTRDRQAALRLTVGTQKWQVAELSWLEERCELNM